MVPSGSMVPKHVAIIMDGNGRWAKARKKPRIFGHKQGVKSVRKIVEHAAKIGVKSLTLYAFSSENWSRPAAEVRLLFELLALTISEQLADLHQNGIRVRAIGDTSALPKRLKNKIDAATKLTQDNTVMTLNLAVNYGARWEIVSATKSIVKACQKNELSPDEITEDLFSAHLSTAGQAELDLMIRTGGECRLSNYLLWQAAYAELYFCERHWPDFNEDDFDQAVAWFLSRTRRFGCTDDQLEQQDQNSDLHPKDRKRATD